MWLAPFGCLYYFQSFSATKVHFIHLVFRWTRELNPCPRTMAQTESPLHSPLDQGASLFTNSFPTLTFMVCTVLAQGNWRKSCSYIVGEIDHNARHRSPITGRLKKYVWNNIINNKGRIPLIEKNIFKILCLFLQSSLKYRDVFWIALFPYIRIKQTKLVAVSSKDPCWSI